MSGSAERPVVDSRSQPGVGLALCQVRRVSSAASSAVHGGASLFDLPLSALPGLCEAQLSQRGGESVQDVRFGGDAQDGVHVIGGPGGGRSAFSAVKVDHLPADEGTTGRVADLHVHRGVPGGLPSADPQPRHEVVCFVEDVSGGPGHVSPGLGDGA